MVSSSPSTAATDCCAAVALTAVASETLARWTAAAVLTLMLETCAVQIESGEGSRRPICEIVSALLESQAPASGAASARSFADPIATLRPRAAGPVPDRAKKSPPAAPVDVTPARCWAFRLPASVVATSL
jgi:hypothetical protein